MKSLIKILFLNFYIITSLSCAACRTMLGPSINDLKIERISLMDYNLARQEYAFGGVSRPNLKILKIGFSSDKDLGTIGINNQLNLSFHAYKCGNEVIELDILSSIYLDKYKINQIRGDYNIQRYKEIANVNNGQQYVYTLFIFPANFEDNQFKYNVYNDPFDICIKVQGHGYMMVNGFISNTMVIPKGTIK